MAYHSSPSHDDSWDEACEAALNFHMRVNQEAKEALRHEIKLRQLREEREQRQYEEEKRAELLQLQNEKLAGELEANRKREAEEREKREIEDELRRQQEAQRQREADAAIERETWRAAERLRKAQAEAASQPSPAIPTPKPATTSQATSSASQQPPAAPAAPAVPATASTVPSATPAAPSPLSASMTAPTNQLVTSQEQKDAEHRLYLGVHKRLKVLRQDLSAHGKQNPAYKAAMGDGRRAITKFVGQLTPDKSKRSTIQKNIVGILQQSTKMSHPAVDAREYFVNYTSPPQASDPRLPALTIYLANIFAKVIVKQLLTESGKVDMYDSIGIVAVFIFAHNDFQWWGNSFIELLVTKLHVSCPVLFGIYGDESNGQGRARMGWTNDYTEQQHGERMTALGSGFAAISLRNFQNVTSMKNPYPPHNYWKALAGFINTPPGELTNTHFLVLKGMLEPMFVERYIEFFGGAALAALQLVSMKAGRMQFVAAKALVVHLKDVLKRDINLTL